VTAEVTRPARPALPPIKAGALAAEAGVAPEYVRELVAAGALHPNPDGGHDPDDIPRVRLAAALANAGIDTRALMWAIEKDILQLDRIAGLWRVAAPGGRPYGEFAASLGERGRDLGPLYIALGLAEPPRDAPIGQDEERVLADLLKTWADVDPRPEVSMRAARITGEGVRRIQLATLDLLDEHGGSPPQRIARGLGTDEANRPSIRLGSLMPNLLLWLQARHLENEVFGRIVQSVQARLAEQGMIERSPTEPPTIAFVDLTGYTEMTSIAGDEIAAASAAKLQGLADDAARLAGGRVVKLLGDGVMLRFESAEGAARGVLALMAAVEAASLPPAHAGMAAGPVVVRDGDVYGNTVNLASRIAGHATAGEVLVNDTIAGRLSKAGIELELVGATVVRGIPSPVLLARVRR
jgi:adenylate cyclase